jgi:LEA14-like dessication related protein
MIRSHKQALQTSLAAAALLAASCSTMPRDFEVPHVNIVSMTPKEMAVFEQKFDVQLRIQNPNDMELGVKGLRFDIELNDREFANGMSGQRITVPRFGSEIVDVEVFTTLGSFLRQVQGFGASAGNKVRYRLKGTAFVEAPSTFKAPFEEHGEIDLNLAPSDVTAPPSP